MKTLFRFVLRVFFGFRAENEAVLDTPGPVLLLPNHTSWFDWIFLIACVDPRWRFVTSMQTAQTSWLHHLLMVNRFTFPVETNSPYAVKRMAEFLQAGGRLVLFPEGRISRTGCLMKLFDGTGFLLFKTNAKVITCYLRGASRLPSSPNPNRKRWFPRVTVHFSELFTPPQLHDVSTTRARYKLTRWAYDLMVAPAIRSRFGRLRAHDSVKHYPHSTSESGPGRSGGRHRRETHLPPSAHRGRCARPPVANLDCRANGASASAFCCPTPMPCL